MEGGGCLARDMTFNTFMLHRSAEVCKDNGPAGLARKDEGRRGVINVRTTGYKIDYEGLPDLRATSEAIYS